MDDHLNQSSMWAMVSSKDDGELRPSGHRVYRDMRPMYVDHNAAWPGNSRGEQRVVEAMERKIGDRNLQTVKRVLGERWGLDDDGVPVLER